MASKIKERGYKKCSKCKVEKSLDLFFKNKTRADGVSSYCRKCVAVKRALIIDADGEVWKDVAGYEGYYQISNKGRVKSLERTVYTPLHKEKIVYERLMSLKPNKHGYSELRLNKDGNRECFKCHRLVAIAFIPNPENKPQINHINGIKTDNRVENLEWCTRKENMQHAFEIGLMPRGENRFSSKLTDDQVLAIRKMGFKQNQSETARQLGVSRSSIQDIMHNRKWTHLI